MHVLSTSYLTLDGGRQLLHLTSGGCTPLHFNFFYSSQLSNETWAVSLMNYMSRQWTHLPFGPCWHNIFAVPTLSLRSTAVQLKHFPFGPWLHFDFSDYDFSTFLLYFSSLIEIQFKNFPPGGWLHFELTFFFLDTSWNTRCRWLWSHYV